MLTRFDRLFVHPGVSDTEISIRLTAMEEYYRSTGFTFKRNDCQLMSTDNIGIRTYLYSYSRPDFDIVKANGEKVLRDYPGVKFEKIWERSDDVICATISFNGLSEDEVSQIKERLYDVGISLLVS